MFGLPAYLQDIFFPRFCCICKKEGAGICQACKMRCAYAPMVCPFCETPSPTGATCMICRTSHSLDGCVSLFSYADTNVQKIISEIKFHKKFSVIQDVIIDVVEVAQLVIETQSVMMPAPQTRNSFMEKGFNHAEILARALAKYSLCAFTNPLRISGASVQHEQTRQTRLKERVQQISCKGVAKKIPHAIVVDDLITTGATLDACAVRLKAYGIPSVWGITLARQPKKFL